MANEIIMKKANTVVLPNFEAQKEDEIRRLKISVRVTPKRDGKGTFKSVKGFVILPTLDRDGNKLFEGIRKISVHFRQDAFKESKNVSQPSELKSGYLYVKASGLRIPPYYQVTTDDKGNDVYPAIWIDFGVLGFEPIVVPQSNLDVDNYQSTQDVEIVDDETGEIIDEQESFEVNGNE